LHKATKLKKGFIVKQTLDLVIVFELVLSQRQVVISHNEAPKGAFSFGITPYKRQLLGNAGKNSTHKWPTATAKGLVC
jgi:hypothetical protein